MSPNYLEYLVTTRDGRSTSGVIVAETVTGVTLRRAGVTRTMRPRHVVLATSVSGIPNLPEIAGLKDFAGKVVHSSQYDDGENWKGKRAIVIGTGNSGHDIAQDLYSSGAEVTIVQRSPTLIVSIEPSAQLVYSPYNEGTLDDNDLIATSMPLPLARKVPPVNSTKLVGLASPRLADVLTERTPLISVVAPL